MASSTTETLRDIKIHKVPNFDVWEDQYGQVDGIGTDDIVVIPPTQLDQHMMTLVPTPGTSNPAMDGTASPGASSTKTFSKSDHVHPTDTSRAPNNHASSATTYGTGTSSNYGHLKLSDSHTSTSGTSGGIAATPSAVKSAYDLANGKQSQITASGILKGDGNGGVTAAVAGTDYLAPGSGDMVYEEATTEHIKTFEEDWIDCTNGAYIFYDQGTSSSNSNTGEYTYGKLGKGSLNNTSGIAFATRYHNYIRIFWSTDDGKTWELKNTNVNFSKDFRVYFLKYLGGIWVLGFQINNSYQTASRIYTSIDLENWTLKNYPSDNSYSTHGIDQLVYLNGYFYATIWMEYSSNYYGAVYSIPENELNPNQSQTGTSPLYGWTKKSNIAQERMPFLYTYGDYIFYPYSYSSSGYLTNPWIMQYVHKNDASFTDSSKRLSFPGTLSTSHTMPQANNEIYKVSNTLYFMVTNRLYSFEQSGNSFINPTEGAYIKYNNNNIYGYAMAIIDNYIYVATGLNLSDNTIRSYILKAPLSNLNSSTIIRTGTYNNGYGVNYNLIYLEESNTLIYQDYTAIGVYPYIAYTTDKYQTTNELQDNSSNTLIIPASQLSFNIPIGYLTTGQYTGNGTYGQYNPNSLSFDFEPYLIIINRAGAGLQPGAATSGSSVANVVANLSAFWINGFLWTKGATSINGGVTCAQNGNSFVWYSTGSAGQLNDNGIVYNYIAIGTKS